MALSKRGLLSSMFDAARNILFFGDAEGQYAQGVAIVDADGEHAGTDSAPLVTQPGGGSVAPFGEALSITPRQVAQLKCPNDSLNDQMFSIHDTKSGSTVASSGEMLIQTSSTAGSGSYMHSKRFISYKTGQGAEARFTARFPDGGIAGTTQFIGVGDYEDGLYIGYSGTSFGFLRRRGGQTEVRTLTITAAPTVSGDIDIALNGGTAVTVAVLDTDTIGDVVRKIRTSTWTDSGGGWDTHGDGEMAEFLALGTDARSGTYTLTDTGGTGVTGTFAQEAAAVAADDTGFTAMSSFSEDQGDGAGSLPVIDLTKGNVFKITWQWLGYGAIRLYIEDPDSGSFVLAHIIKYANANAEPSLSNPDMPLSAIVDNGAVSSSVSIVSASMAGFIVGDSRIESDVRGSARATATVGTAETPLLAIKLKHVYNGKTNKIRVNVDELAIASESSKFTEFRMYKAVNGDFGLVGSPSWTDVNANNSVMSYCTDATGFTGGQFIRGLGTGASGAAIVPLTNKRSVTMAPGDILLLTANVSSGSSSVVQASMSWLEAW